VAIKLLAADFVEDEVTLESVRALREQIAEISALLAGAEARVHEFPHRERYLRLNHAFMRKILEAHQDLVDRVEEELGP
jgi:DNA-binding GntR family transcriptional regulator